LPCVLQVCRAGMPKWSARTLILKEEIICLDELANGMGVPTLFLSNITSSESPSMLLLSVLFIILASCCQRLTPKIYSDGCSKTVSFSLHTNKLLISWYLCLNYNFCKYTTHQIKIENSLNVCALGDAF